MIQDKLDWTCIKFMDFDFMLHYDTLLKHFPNKWKKKFYLALPFVMEGVFYFNNFEKSKLVWKF